MNKFISIPENIAYSPCKVKRYILSHKLGANMASLIYKVPGYHFNLRAKTIAARYFSDSLSHAKELAKDYGLTLSSVHLICYNMLIELQLTKKIVKRS